LKIDIGNIPVNFDESGFRELKRIPIREKIIPKNVKPFF